MSDIEDAAEDLVRHALTKIAEDDAAAAEEAASLKKIDDADKKAKKAKKAKKPKAPKKPKEPKPDDRPVWIDETQTIDGKLWIKGSGNLPCDTMFVGDKPGPDETAGKTPMAGKSSRLFETTCRDHGVETWGSYFTNAVKYPTSGHKSATAGDMKLCNRMLKEEIVRCKPKIIVCMGATAVKCVLGATAKLADCHGESLPYPDDPTIKVFSLYGASHVVSMPDVKELYYRDIDRLSLEMRGKTPPQEETNFWVIQTVAQLQAFLAILWGRYPRPLLSVDLEWHGRTWMDPDRYTRTVQIGFDVGWAVVVEMTGVGGVPVMDDADTAWELLRDLFQDPRIGMLGQNIISDGEWMMSTHGIDIRDRVVFDTMLAEHTINETGPFGLTELTLKYTKMGRYDREVHEWRDAHKDLTKDGYGNVPRELLIPYGAKDVDAPLRIAIAQTPALRPFMEPRGQYPSLWATVMGTQKSLYEIEQVGMLVDQERLYEMVDKYQDKLQTLISKLKVLAHKQGMPDFAHSKVAQVRTLMFDKLGLEPIKTTKNKAWGEYMLHQQDDARETNTPSTDKTVLEIHEEKHPAVKVLAQVRKVDTVCKTWLRRPAEDGPENESTKGGGIPAKIWPDGRLHSHFSQLSDTGRFRTSKPNAQNWPKKGEGYMEAIFGGKENTPPLLRTIVIPPPGYLFMEADYIQAELFVLASLSGDVTMKSALTTPGKDMHDMTAISAFGLQLMTTDDVLIPEQSLLDMAARDMDEFDDYIKKVIYLDQKGRKLTRKDFKEGIRISAKNLNFGIPYGRGALDIARQVKAETGTDVDIEQLENDISEMMVAWKTQTYPTAWEFMESCSAAVTDPGYLVNPWGRMRRFPEADENWILASMQRKAQNFPIQSTVADTCMLALLKMRKYRKEHELNFRIVNQVHDAFMLEVPEDEVDDTKIMFQATMGNIEIPMSPQPLKLGIDIDVMTRWGEKVK